MIRKSYLILIILLSLPIAAFGFGSKDSSEKELSKHEKQWKNNGMKNYTQEIIYSRSTFPPEKIIITVSNNIVQNWSTNSGEKNFSEDFIKSLTIENMFNKAREIINPEKDSPFEFKILYNKELGYITSFSRVPSTKENKNISVPFDKSYSIDVISLKPAGKDL